MRYLFYALCLIAGLSLNVLALYGAVRWLGISAPGVIALGAVGFWLSPRGAR